jgi:hypothetical protein
MTLGDALSLVTKCITTVVPDTKVEVDKKLSEVGVVEESQLDQIKTLVKLIPSAGLPSTGFTITDTDLQSVTLDTKVSAFAQTVQTLSRVNAQQVSHLHPGIIGLVAYLSIVLVVCLWLLVSFLTALPPRVGGQTNGNDNAASNSANTNARNTNENTNAGNTSTNSATNTSISRNGGDSPRFQRAAYVAQGTVVQNRNENVGNPSGTSATGARSNPDNQNRPARAAARSNNDGIQGIPNPVTITVYWFGFGSKTYTLSSEAYLLMIVIAASALGVVGRTIFSIFRHIGLGDFSFRWTWYYILSPFGGIALSVTFYLVVRGGFYNPATSNGDLPLNPFSFAALGALTGLFSENAMLKLKTIAEVLFMRVEEKSNQPRA